MKKALMGLLGMSILGGMTGGGLSTIADPPKRRNRGADPKLPLTKKQWIGRARSKAARKARRLQRRLLKSKF